MHWQFTTTACCSWEHDKERGNHSADCTRFKGITAKISCEVTLSLFRLWSSDWIIKAESLCGAVGMLAHIPSEGWTDWNVCGSFQIFIQVMPFLQCICHTLSCAGASSNFWGRLRPSSLRPGSGLRPRCHQFLKISIFTRNEWSWGWVGRNTVRD